MKKWLFLIMVLLVIVNISLAVYFIFFNEKDCFNSECFQENMRSCKKASYINQDEQSTWLYEIKGKKSEGCEIVVSLLSVKDGELDITKLEGYNMVCYYTLGVFAYPEKNLAKCHGRLKEELQTKIIEKMHSIILENLKDFNSELNEF